MWSRQHRTRPCVTLPGSWRSTGSDICLWSTTAAGWSGSSASATSPESLPHSFARPACRRSTPTPLCAKGALPGWSMEAWTDRCPPAGTTTSTCSRIRPPTSSARAGTRPTSPTTTGWSRSAPRTGTSPDRRSDAALAVAQQVADLLEKQDVIRWGVRLLLEARGAKLPELVHRRDEDVVDDGGDNHEVQCRNDGLHQTLGDRRDHRGERRADDDGYGKVDHVTSGDELSEPFQHGYLSKIAIRVVDHRSDALASFHGSLTATVNGIAARSRAARSRPPAPTKPPACPLRRSRATHRLRARPDRSVRARPGRARKTRQSWSRRCRTWARRSGPPRRRAGSGR